MPMRKTGRVRTKRGGAPPRLDRSRIYAEIHSPHFRGFEQDGYIFDAQGAFLLALPPAPLDAPPTPKRPTPPRIGPNDPEWPPPSLAPQQRREVLDTIAHRASKQPVRNAAAPRIELSKDLDSTTLFPRTDVERVLGPLLDADTLPAVLDEIEGVVAVYCQNAAADRRLPGRKSRKKSLQRLDRAITSLDTALQETLRLLGDTDGHAALRTAVQSARPWREHVLAQMLSEHPDTSPKLDIHRRWLIQQLAKLYLASTGKQPTVSKDRLFDEYSGPFFELVRLCLTGANISDHAVDKAICRAIQRHTSDS